MRECIHCGDSEEEWGRDSVLLGELTRSDVNSGSWKENAPRPICSRSCLQAEMDEFVPSRSPRFEKTAWRYL